jgi:DNA-directed RNA polymerase subunit M/transcription elongation factor TFIIS
MTTLVEFYVSEKSRKSANKKLILYFEKEDCERIEQGIYDYTEQYCRGINNLSMAQGVYADVTANIIFNCEQGHKTIKKIIKQINNKRYNPYNLAFLKPEELDEDNWMKIILRKNNTEEKLNNLPTVEWKPCRTCKCVQFSFYQLQTRSADEPMTTFYICKQCNKTYRVNN